MNKLLHNNTLFTLTLLGIATALAFLFLSFVSENTANIALLYIIAQILIARYTNGYLHGLFSSVYLSVFPTEFHIERLSGHIYRNVDHYIAHHRNHFPSEETDRNSCKAGKTSTDRTSGIPSCQPAPCSFP